MRLTFLGTSAANAYPEAFCRCRNCRRAREAGGPSLRRRSSLLIDNALLIDLGPDIMSASNSLGVPLTDVRYCFQTHAHADHLDASHLLSRSPGYGVEGAPQLQFHASGGSMQVLEKQLERDLAPYGLYDQATGRRLNAEFRHVTGFERIECGPYGVTAFPATHDPFVEPLLYAVEKDGRTIFYGTDTAAFPERTWDALSQFNRPFDVVILDHTYGPGFRGDDHLDAGLFMDHAAGFERSGLLSDRARILATHISHDANPPHPELAAYAAANGYEIAFDGLVVEV